VTAARDALVLHRVRTIAPDPEQLAKIATTAVLRELVFMMNQAEVAEIVEGGDWPQAHDLHSIANDVEESL
jgi:hypothetical protein